MEANKDNRWVRSDNYGEHSLIIADDDGRSLEEKMDALRVGGFDSQERAHEHRLIYPSWVFAATSRRCSVRKVKKPAEESPSVDQEPSENVKE